MNPVLFSNVTNKLLVYELYIFNIFVIFLMDWMDFTKELVVTSFYLQMFSSLSNIRNCEFSSPPREEKEKSYPSAEMQSTYSKDPADWTRFGLVWLLFYGKSTLVGYLMPNLFFFFCSFLVFFRFCFCFCFCLYDL